MTPSKKWHRAYGSTHLVAYLNAMPCMVCGRVPCDAAHVKSRGAGGGYRDNLVPLCREHHTEQHQIGIETFQNKYQIDMEREARRVDADYNLEF